MTGKSDIHKKRYIFGALRSLSENMVFNSITFVVFFVLFFLAYWILAKRKNIVLRNIFILAGSYFFYGWWDWRFLGLIIFSSLVDFFVGDAIYNAKSQDKRKWLLITSLTLNLGLLGFFKYFNFFIDSFAHLLSIFSIKPDWVTLKIILPVGISFYTFQTLSYSLDIYYKRLKPTKNLLNFLTFVSFFPQLVAGPIERASNLLPQFAGKVTFSYENSIQGLRYVLWGFFKKIVIADNFGLVVDEIFKTNASYGAVTLFAGLLLFSFQIYCDFSGYSDIAIGTARMLGFDLMENFRTPYFSGSLTEFWKRWHISLSTWFRDYVYIPLGGNRVKLLRRDFNLMVTFVLSGFWHGANITFLLWGFIHGAALVAEKKIKLKAPLFLKRVFFFLLVSLFWLPFRAKNYTHLKQIIHGFFHFSGSFSQFHAVLTTNYSGIKLYLMGLIFTFFMILEYLQREMNIHDFFKGMKRPVRFAFYYTLFLAILFLGNFDIKPYFIYFQF